MLLENSGNKEENSIPRTLQCPLSRREYAGAILKAWEIIRVHTVVEDIGIKEYSILG